MFVMCGVCVTRQNESIAGFFQSRHQIGHRRVRPEDIAESINKLCHIAVHTAHFAGDREQLVGGRFAAFIAVGKVILINELPEPFGRGVGVREQPTDGPLVVEERDDVAKVEEDSLDHVT